MKTKKKPGPKINGLHPLARVNLERKNHAYKCLHDLGPDAVAEIDKRLLEGQSGKTVASWLQDDLAVLKDMKPDTLKKTLERYRGGHLRQKTLTRLAGFNTMIPTAIVAARLNALDEIETLARQQRKRVDKLLAKEEEMPAGMLMKGASEEIKTLHGILVDMSKVQLDTGVLQRVAKTVHGTVTNAATGEVQAFSWTQEAERLFQDLENVEVGREDA